MYFQLWDTETRNIVDAYETLADAIEAVRRYVQAEGPQFADRLSVIAEWSDDEVGDDSLLPETLTGSALLARLEGPTPREKLRGVA